MRHPARLLPALLALAAAAALGAATDGVTVGQWNGMLVVTAPGGSDIARLGGRLEQRITLDAREQPLPDTAAFLRSVAGINVVVAPAILANPPLVTLQVRDMSLGNLVRWIERTTGVHAGFLHGALYFSDQPIAGTSVTRIYDVRDLGMVAPDFPGPTLSIPESSGAMTVIPPIAAADAKPHYDLDEIQHLIEQFVVNQK